MNSILTDLRMMDFCLPNSRRNAAIRNNTAKRVNLHFTRGQTVTHFTFIGE